MLRNIPFYASLLGRDMADGRKSNNGMVLVYGAIEVHAMGDKGCIASNGLIAKETGLSTGTVANYVSLMNKSKWVKVNTRINGKAIERVSIEPMLNISIPSHRDDTPLHTEMIPPSHGDDTPLHTEMNIDNNIDNNENTNNKDMSNNIDELKFIHSEICKLFNKSESRYKLSDKRKQKLKSRLKDLGKDGILQACEAITRSEFHMGENQRNWIAEPYWVLENFERAEKWAGEYQNNNKYADLTKLEF